MQVKNKSRFSIFIDEKYSFSLSQDGLLEAGLRIGDELQESDIAKLKKASEDGKLYDRLLGLLATRPRSRWELQSYLDRKKTDSETAESLLKKLESLKLIDDSSFARRWIENRRLLKPTSERKLRMELQQKRVASNIIDEALREDETDELEVLRALVDRKKHLSRFKADKQKFMQFLARQGFNYGDIKSVLDEQTD